MKKRVVILIITSMFLSSALIICGYANSTLLPSEIFMEKIDISYLTTQEAEDKVRDYFNKINFYYAGDCYSYSPDKLGIKIDYQKSFADIFKESYYERIIMNFQKKNFNLHKDFDKVKLLEELKKLNEKVEKKPQNALLKIQEEQLIIQKEQWGIEIDCDILAKQLSTNPLRNQYIIPVRTVAPEINSQDISSLKPDTLLAEYTTEFVKNPDRTQNIKIACQALKNTLIAPGEVISFNEIVGPREAEHGYLYAMIISGGEFIPGLGGGVCQVSSTLYNAALLAGLEIIERHPHSLRINYVPLGKDATVSYGSKDLKIQNNTGGYLKLDYKIEGQYLTFYIYGKKNDDNSK